MNGAKFQCWLGCTWTVSYWEKCMYKYEAFGLQRPHSPLIQFSKMIMFTQLKQRKGKFYRKDTCTRTWTYYWEKCKVQPRFHGISWCVSNGDHYYAIKQTVHIYNCELVLKRGLLPVIQAICGRHNWTLQQDRAPSYTPRFQKHNQLSSGKC